MTIKTYSAFTYGHTINDSNKYIQFDEGSGELTSELPIGSYTLGTFVTAVAAAMNDNGFASNTYSTSVDRTTGFISINSSAGFTLLTGTGSLLGSDAFELMGFETGADLSGIALTGTLRSGSQFEPQFLLQSFVDFIDNVQTVQATTAQSASGAVEVVSYGRVKFAEMNITLQTNIPQGKGSVLKNDANGYENLRAFLDYATTKAPIEFVYDVDNPETGGFVECLLESTRESRDGVNYKLKELYSRGFAEYFESGLLTFRELV